MQNDMKPKTTLELYEMNLIVMKNLKAHNIITTILYLMSDISHQVIYTHQTNSITGSSDLQLNSLQ